MIWNAIDAFEIKIIQGIQTLRNPVFDFIFKWITEIGDKYIFALILVVIYWTIDKKKAYQFFFAYALSAGINTVIKPIFKRMRPYQQGALSIGKMTSGYSFPSGHAQATGVIIYGIFQSKWELKAKRIAMVLLALLIPFSRLYLGQHFLSDVIVGLILGIILAYMGYYLFSLMKDKEAWIMVALVPVFLLALLVQKDIIWMISGGFIGFSIGYVLEKQYVRFDVSKGDLKFQIVKVTIGLIGVALIYSIGYFLLDMTVLWHAFIIFLMMAFWASFGAPFVFKCIDKG